MVADVSRETSQNDVGFATVAAPFPRVTPICVAKNA